VLYDPAHDALYAASQGDGALLNGSRLQVSACAISTLRPSKCGWSTRRSTADYMRSWPR
jgi:fructose-1,6-bisphosphatase/inositol monophosphatase family enzyme